MAVSNSVSDRVFNECREQLSEKRSKGILRRLISTTSDRKSKLVAYLAAMGAIEDMLQVEFSLCRMHSAESVSGSPTACHSSFQTAGPCS